MRPADFAYQGWYPYTKDDCLRQIKAYEKQRPACPQINKPVGGIVPHAGWFFSGKLAYHVISCLHCGTQPDTIIILGKHTNHPDDISSRRKNSIMVSGSWETPLGPLEIDTQLSKGIQEKFSLTIESEEDYEFDNTIELQLPFIRHVFPKAKIVPLGIVDPSQASLSIGKYCVHAAQELHRSIKLIGTTDMTHYGPGYGFTPQGVGEQALEWMTSTNDQQMIDLFLHLQSEKILEEAQKKKSCCCSAAIATLTAALQEMNVKNGVLVDYYTSHEIKPGMDFVGYAGVIY